MQEVDPMWPSQIVLSPVEVAVAIKALKVAARVSRRAGDVDEADSFAAVKDSLMARYSSPVRFGATEHGAHRHRWRPGWEAASKAWCGSRLSRDVPEDWGFPCVKCEANSKAQ